MTDAAEIKACLNCGQGLSGKYCAACGQKDRPLNPSMSDLLQDMTQQFFDFDGRIFRSLKALFASPGLLTREYLSGRRAMWMAPVRLYVSISVAYFALGALTGPSIMGLPRGSGEVEPPTPAEALPALQSMGFSSVAQLEQATQEAGQTWMPRVMFILIPFLAVLVHAVQRGSGLRYPQHLIFALHVQAAWFAIFALFDIAAWLLHSDTAGSVLYLAGLLGSIVYLALALGKAYGGKWGWNVLKAVLIGSVYGLITVSFTTGIIVPLAL